MQQRRSNNNDDDIDDDDDEDDEDDDDDGDDDDNGSDSEPTPKPKPNPKPESESESEVEIKDLTIKDEMIKNINKGFREKKKQQLNLTINNILSSKLDGDDIILQIKNLILNDGTDVKVIVLIDDDDYYEVSINYKNKKRPGMSTYITYLIDKD